MVSNARIVGSPLTSLGSGWSKLSAAGVLVLPASSSGASPARWGPTNFTSIFLERRNVTFQSSLTVQGVEFQDYRSTQRSYPIAFSPTAFSPFFPVVTTSRLNITITEGSSLWVPGATPGCNIRATAPGDPFPASCDPSQSLVLYDSDGSLLRSNSSATIGKRQGALTLLSCSALFDELSSCLSTLRLGRLNIMSWDRAEAYSLRGVIQVTDVSNNLRPTFIGTVGRAPLANQLTDSWFEMVVQIGVNVELMLTPLPRVIRLSFSHCTSSSGTNTVVKLRYRETDMRQTVWVGGVVRHESTAEPTTLSRSGDWYRNPTGATDYVAGDESDWVAVVVGCDDRVELHQIVFASVTIIFNVSFDILDGMRPMLISGLSRVAGRPVSTILVDHMSPSNLPTQTQTIFKLEALDSYLYDPVAQTALLNEAIEGLRKLSAELLTDYFVDSPVYQLRSVTYARSDPYFVIVQETKITLVDVFYFSGVVGLVVLVVGGLYWWLKLIRIQDEQKRVSHQAPMTIGREQRALPDVDLTSIVCETDPSTSETAQLEVYLQHWTLSLLRQGQEKKLSAFRFGSHTPMGHSFGSTDSPDFTPNDRPSAPPKGKFGSVVASFLDINNEDNRLQTSPRVDSLANRELASKQSRRRVTSSRSPNSQVVLARPHHASLVLDGVEMRSTSSSSSRNPTSTDRSADVNPETLLPPTRSGAWSPVESPMIHDGNEFHEQWDFGLETGVPEIAVDLADSFVQPQQPATKNSEVLRGLDSQLLAPAQRSPRTNTRQHFKFKRSSSADTSTAVTPLSVSWSTMVPLSSLTEDAGSDPDAPAHPEPPSQRESGGSVSSHFRFRRQSSS